ncbi:GNAT family N-acetyltransferase [Paraburkholderia tropica]|uniref:GNAT family N-acetyltransferase n=1 Tax=Paraburkholderia tropica TaxID=92647 RepID=UPI002AAF5570|nr:GNAT family N-acetyltransferase [Paraburkholderia tropica]
MPIATSLLLRPATAADADLLAAMHAASWQATYRGLLPAAFLDREVGAERAAYWRARMEAPGADRRLVLIAEIAEIAAVNAAHNAADEEAPRTPAGFVCVERQPDSPWGVLLDNLHALPAHQGVGVGKTLMEAARRWARGQGESQLYLYVLDGNTPAIAFYERQGWEYSGAEPDHMGGVDITALRYVYRLDARA